MSDIGEVVGLLHALELRLERSCIFEGQIEEDTGPAAVGLVLKAEVWRRGSSGTQHE